MKNGHHELEMAGDAVEQDVLLKLILVVHVTDLEQKTKQRNRRSNDKKTSTIMRAGDDVKRDVFLKISPVIFK